MTSRFSHLFVHVAEIGRARTFYVDRAWGARHAWLHDPDGTPVSIYSRTDASEETA